MSTAIAVAVVPVSTPDDLKRVIGETLSPYANIRKNAEDVLTASKSQPGHALAILQLVASLSTPIDAAIRQAAAVHFKNLVQKGWDTAKQQQQHEEHGDDNDGDGIVILLPEEERMTIKSHLVQLMCETPPQIQVQLSTAISLIAASDYYKNWQDLLPSLVQQFQSTDIHVVIGVLKTANSIFKSFRYVQRSDALYETIIYTLQHCQAQLLALFKHLGDQVHALAASTAATTSTTTNKESVAEQVKLRLEALRLCSRIFYSLNYQDLPAYFEDHMAEIMMEFAKYLQQPNVLTGIVDDPDEELEPSALDQLQAAIINNLALYADKDEEVFIEQFLPQFTTLVWNNLLVTVTAYSKHDLLATTSIKFLSSLVAKPMHASLFESSPETLPQIVAKIVIPNLYFRQSDEERFFEDESDDAREYMVTEVEGSDSESRRKCAQDLLRSMCRQYEEQTTRICSLHVSQMLQTYATAPNDKWADKDAAIHLMMGIAIRKVSMAGGVSEINDGVNVMDFFSLHILPELQDVHHEQRPVVKAACIKYVATFRNQFSSLHLIQLVPLLIAHLGSPIVVVHTFAAYALERLLTATEQGQPKIGANELQPVLESLFTALFRIIDNEAQNENDYVMKCVMRSLATARQDIVPVTPIVLEKLTATLGRVAKNPRNPQYNHYLFESIAILIRSVCSQNPAATEQLEVQLFVPFNHILQYDVEEFTPYVFQIFAQLLEYRPNNAGLGDAYTQLFPPLMTPSLWEKRGNIPALTRLVQAYIRQAASELVDKVQPILGVFQKLLSIARTERFAFMVVNAAICNFPHAALEPYLGRVLQLLLTRLQTSRNSVRYVGLLTEFFAILIGKYGAAFFVQCLNALQPNNNLAGTLISQIWLPHLRTNPPVQMELAKTHAMGLLRLLFGDENNSNLNIIAAPSVFLSNPAGHAVWSQMVAALTSLVSSNALRDNATNSRQNQRASGVDALDEEIKIGSDNEFSELRFARQTSIHQDVFAEITADPAQLFGQALQVMVRQQQPIMPLIQQGLGQDAKLLDNFQTLLEQQGVQLG